MNKLNNKKNITKIIKFKNLPIIKNKFKNQKEPQKKQIDYKNFTIKEIEQELKRETYKSKYKKVFMSTIYTLVIVASISALIATLVMPVLQISGSSMNPTIHEGDIVLTIKTKTIKSKDIIAFYYGNKILVKRVIAEPGSWVNITEDGNIYINEELLDEPYIEIKSLGNIDIEFPYQVPEDSYFVLGDEREKSIDSRNSIIGSISKKEIIGKVIFRVWPIKQIGILNS